ncbi:SDR family oxidoreductase [Propylenella binzhouense]|uniref:SDR family oxidoreductase n=1 Tax=Propylenella binzhouense TaxID=2555902 RepID=A0A964T2U6_9HYPH|nr:SDR family oxidoreductase [Propylenella binzhouense]
MTRQKLAVVTGGASGIGAACVRKFAAEGWRTLIADVNVPGGEALERQLADEGRACEFRRLDVSSEEDVSAFAAALSREAGPLDALINSAGILQGAVRLTDMTMQAYDAIMAVNLRGAVLMGRAIGSLMADEGGGAIVNLCSISSVRASAQPAYATSKAGLKMLTEIMAAELGPRGVRVNAVAPGYTMTPLMASLITKGQRDPELVVERSALRRFVEPEEVADGIFFLCSDAARSITGVLLPIDCGWLAYSAYSAFATQPD